MWRHQTMCRQRMWRQNVASQENVASPNNVSPKNVAPKCGVTGQCGVTKQCGAKMWRHREMWRHQTMWRQTMQRQNVASQENAASPNNVAPKKVAPHVFEMCLHNVSSASGGKVRALLPTPCIYIYIAVIPTGWEFLGSFSATKRRFWKIRGDDFRYRFEAGLPPESLGHVVWMTYFAHVLCVCWKNTCHLNSKF